MTAKLARQLSDDDRGSRRGDTWPSEAPDPKPSGVVASEDLTEPPPDSEGG
jgi:hypothetical protein